MSERRDRFVAELAASLRGPRRRRRRLVDEINAHLDDAVHDEVARGSTPLEAETAVLLRLGSASEIAAPWNDDRLLVRGDRRRKILAVALAVLGAGALGVTQYASGKPKPAEPARTCAEAVRDNESPCRLQSLE